MAKPKKLSRNIATAGLIANIFLPGVGTIVIGKYDIGTIQLVLALLSIFLSIMAVGIPFFIAVWIWALVTGIKAIKRAK